MHRWMKAGAQKSALGGGCAGPSRLRIVFVMAGRDFMSRRRMPPALSHRTRAARIEAGRTKVGAELLPIGRSAAAHIDSASPPAHPTAMMSAAD